MTTDTFSIVATDNTTSPATITTSSVNISSVGMTELLGWAIVTFFPLGVLTSGVVGGTGADAPTYRPAGPQDALDYITQSVLSAYESEAHAWLQAQASAQAAAAVPPVQ